MISKFPRMVWGEERDDGYAATAPVGRFKPNAWGLYDAVGNAWEWCQDWYAGGYGYNCPKVDPPGPSSGEKRVLRGGSWGDVPRVTHLTYREALLPHIRVSRVGFRVVYRLKPTPGVPK
jgi:formylglycine-generating enzyme required for sulfatase activity